MKRSTLVLIISAVFAVNFALSQNVDSLVQVLKQAKQDTLKVQTLCKIIDATYDPVKMMDYSKQLNFICQKNVKTEKNDRLYKFYLRNIGNHVANLGGEKVGIGDMDSALYYFHKALDIKRKAEDGDGEAAVLVNMAYVYGTQGDYQRSIAMYKEGLIAAERINNKFFLSTIYNNMGEDYQSLGLMEEFLDCAFKALKIREEENDENGLYYSYHNLGSYYEETNEIEKALSYFEKSLKIARKLNILNAVSRTLGNQANCYVRLKDHKKAMSLLDEAYKISEGIDDKVGMAHALSRKGVNLHQFEKRSDEAIELIKKSTALWEQVGQKAQIAANCRILGKIYFETGKINEAEICAKRSLVIAREIATPKDIGPAAALLKDIYTRQGNYKDALAMTDLSVLMNDSINNIAVRKATYKQGVKYEYEKKAAADSVVVAQEKQTAQLKVEKERTQKYALYIGLALVLVFAGFMFNRFKVTQKQKNIIQLQKHVVEEKQKEIVDSINYAKRIQTALLASDKLMSDNLQDHFIYYHPKDIVAGDFYWATNTNEGFIYVTADCTGHGVPGAFMSVLSITKLNECINQMNITRPDLILNSVRTEIIHALNPEGSKEESKDGMDAVLCKLDRKKMKLHYAAANNSFYIVRNNELQTHKADKMPVGKSINDTMPFILHEVDLQKGDVIYTLTDGYADQFGGPKGKKLRYKQLEELLLKISGLDMAGQRAALSELFDSWKGLLEQVDDVCIIGVRV
jgi:serine phosphatase RsbU (regulator of sigma subunit)